MSKIKKIQLKCSKCGEVFTFDSYETIDGSDHELKKKVVTKEIFRTNCPKCGSLHHVNFPTIYYDAEKHYVLRIISNKTDLDNFEDLPLNKETVFDNNLCRLVADMYELVENILVLDANLNDRAVEAVKIVVLSSKDMDRKKIRSCYFAGKFDNRLRFDVVDNDGSIHSAYVNMDGYEKCYESEKKEFDMETNEWQFVNLKYGLDFMAKKLNIAKQQSETNCENIFKNCKF